MYSPAIFILLAWLLIYVPTPVAGFVRARLEGGYDNRHPRLQQATLTGLAARAVGAHNNGLEAFPAFAAAAILCALTRADPALSQAFSAGFLVARLLYVAFYLGDLHALRSLCWVAAVVNTAALYVLAIRA